jgi:hypothetical protein
MSSVPLWDNSGFWEGLPLWLLYHSVGIAWLSLFAGITLIAAGIRRDYYLEGGTMFGWFMKTLGTLLLAWPILWAVAWIVIR